MDVFQNCRNTIFAGLPPYEFKNLWVRSWVDITLRFKFWRKSSMLMLLSPNCSVGVNNPALAIKITFSTSDSIGY